MELRDYLRVLRKGWAVILAVVIVGLAVGVGLTLATKKVYQASVQIFVGTAANSDPSALNGTNNYITQRVQSYISIANSPQVTGPVIKELQLQLTDQQLADKISADAPTGRVLINIHVNDHSPTLAARLANAVADEFNIVIPSTEQPDAQGNPPVKLTVIHPATIPSNPISPKKIINIGLGLAVGLILGVAFVLVREVLDNTVKGPEDFEPLGVPVFGHIPLDKRTSDSPIAFRDDPHSARSEAFRHIRTNLQFVNPDNPPRIIAVSSAVPGEGKTTTAMNLAAALAEAGARVCLVEADLRRPTVAGELGLVGDVGFTTVVIGKAPVESVLQNAGRNLAVLTSGPIPPNPSELLLSKHAKQVIFDIAAKVDFTIIDTPPLLPVTDGAELATVADGMILVHRAGKTTRDQALRAMEALDKVGKKPIGVVLNMITRQGGKYDYEYGYSYAAYRPNVDPKKGRRGEPPVGETFQPDTNPLTNPSGTATAPAESPEPQRGRRRRGKSKPETAAAPAGTGTSPTVTASNPPIQSHFSDAQLSSAAGAPVSPPAQLAQPATYGETEVPPAPPASENGYEANGDQGGSSYLPPQPQPLWFRPGENQ